MNTTVITILIGVASVVGWAGLLLLIIYIPKWKRQHDQNRKGQGMAKKRPTWDIEYGVEPNKERYSGYNRTVTERLLAATHDEAVALLKEYDPDFDPKDIISSKRGGLEYIVAEKQS
jgi:hypothetical protein